MKKITSLLLFLPSILFGQIEDTTHKSKFDFGFTVSPDYCYRLLKADDENNWLKENADTLEIRRVGFSVGVNVVYRYSDKLTFSSGLLFSDKGERTKKYLTPQLNNYIDHYYYLDIPLKANYYLLERDKFKLFVSAGLSANVFLKHSIVSLVEGFEADFRMVDNTNISRVNLGANAGIGFDCPLTNKWYFKMEAMYRQSITSIGNAPVKKYLLSVSPTIGFYYHF